MRSVTYSLHICYFCYKSSLPLSQFSEEGTFCSDELNISLVTLSLLSTLLLYMCTFQLLNYLLISFELNAELWFIFLLQASQLFDLSLIVVFFQQVWCHSYCHCGHCCHTVCMIWPLICGFFYNSEDHVFHWDFRQFGQECIFVVKL